MSNNYLIKAIEAIQNLGPENVDPKDVTKLLFELKVSNLLIPAMDDDDGLSYETFVLEDEDLILLPLFTSQEEFYRYYDEGDEFEPMENEFEIYAAIVGEEEIDGIVIDAEGVAARIPKDMVEFAEADFSISFDDLETRSKKQIKKTYSRASNKSLVRFIEKESNKDNFEGLMVQLSNSDMLNLVVSHESLDGYAKNGVIKAMDAGGFNLFGVDDGEAFYAAMFTDKDAILKAIPENDGLHYYGQLTKVSSLFDFVLRNDMDGVIINPNTHDFIIPRSEFLSQASGIELVVEDQSFRNCLDYAFLV
jgi:hypothetical protein